MIISFYNNFKLWHQCPFDNWHYCLPHITFFVLLLKENVQNKKYIGIHMQLGFYLSIVEQFANLKHSYPDQSEISFRALMKTTIWKTHWWPWVVFCSFVWSSRSLCLWHIPCYNFFSLKFSQVLKSSKLTSNTYCLLNTYIMRSKVHLIKKIRKHWVGWYYIFILSQKTCIFFN